ncbi:MAG: 3'-5' exoribonuclease YhaM family protein [Planctomycetaceae bacterium]
MPRKNLKEYAHGDAMDEVFLLAEKQLRANRNADLYLLATLRDSSGQMNGMMWNVTEESVGHISTGDFIRVRGKVQLYQGAFQCIITHIDHVDSAQVNPDDFHPESSREAKKYVERFKEICSQLRPDLKAITDCFQSDEQLMSDFSSAPAGIKAHHAYPGGLVEHTVTMMEVAAKLRDIYPDLDVDLLLVGVFLHDLGKTQELEWETSFLYSDPGQLIGHMPMAVEMLSAKVAEVHARGDAKIEDETVWRLKHMIISHHGTYEFGSSRLPMTPEATALHYIDNLDAKLHEFTRTIHDDPDGSSNWTPYSPRLQRKLYKGQRTPGAES